MTNKNFWLAKLLGILIVTVTFTWQCGDNNPFAPETRGDNEVWIQNRQFVPQTLTVSNGTTVKWTNKDNEVHTVDSGVPKTDPTPIFNSPNLNPNQTFSHKFSNAGTFKYFCAIHGETGTIIVQ